MTGGKTRRRLNMELLPRCTLAPLSTTQHQLCVQTEAITIKRTVGEEKKTCLGLRSASEQQSQHGYPHQVYDAQRSPRSAEQRTRRATGSAGQRLSRVRIEPGGRRRCQGGRQHVGMRKPSTTVAPLPQIVAAIRSPFRPLRRYPERLLSLKDK